MTAGVVVEPLDDADRLTDLAAEAQRDGHRMVSQLIAEWRDGTNRFTAPGESLYVASLDGEIVGVCGLNVDPYADDPTVGRVRRLFVSVSQRRHGIGSVLVERIVSDARGRFRLLRLRTFNPIAAAFYRSHGFIDVVGDEHCTHHRELAG